MTSKRWEPAPEQWPRLKPAPAVLALYTSDARAIAEVIVGNALEWVSARRQCDLDAILQSLNQGDARVQRELNLGLARFVAEYLGYLDRDVKAVYIANYADTDRDKPGEGAFAWRIHLVVYAEPKTAALTSLLSALNRALVLVLSASVEHTDNEHFLQVQLVNSVDLENLARYASLLNAPGDVPARIWQREPSASPHTRVSSGERKPRAIKPGRAQKTMPDTKLQKG